MYGMLTLSNLLLREAALNELKRLMVAEPATAPAKLSIGSALADRLIGEDIDDEFVPTSSNPLTGLYMWLLDGWRLDPEWLADESGNICLDDGTAGPPAKAFAISPAMHLLSLGRWLIEVPFNQYGSAYVVSGDGITNDQGVPLADLESHQLSCVALAWQAIGYAEKLRSGQQPTPDEIAAAARTKTARAAANALHDKPGGTRDKQRAIRAAWASGKFSDRDRCAEEECAALGMSLSAARRALRNTADPSRR